MNRFLGRFRNTVHENLIEPVLTQRNQNRKLLYVLFFSFSLFTIVSPIIYYNSYIHNQLQRVDLSYSEIGDYDLSSNKVVCDCAIPMMINPENILSDPDYLQPRFRSCLSNHLSNYYFPIFVNSTTSLIMLNILGTPILDIQKHRQTFQNILISRNVTLMQNIGNFLKLQYINAIYQVLHNFISIFMTQHFEMTYLVQRIIMGNENDTEIQIQRQLYFQESTSSDVLKDIVNCSSLINVEDLDPLIFVNGLNEEDCFPVDCHTFVNYDFFQTVLLLVTFYLAIVGYFVCFLQCIYQKNTKVENTDTENHEVTEIVENSETSESSESEIISEKEKDLENAEPIE